MKSVFVFPPVWSKKSPSTGLSLIKGYLNLFGYDSEIIDLNIDFYDELLTDKNYNTVYDYINNLCNSSNLSNNEIAIINIFKKNFKMYNYIKNKVDLAVKSVKSKHFYDIQKYKINSFIIRKAVEFITLPYYPIFIFDEKIKNISIGTEMLYEDYKKEAINTQNVFYKFIKNNAKKIAEKNPKLVGISINFEGQMLAGLTLAYILKNIYNIKIVLGGTHITRIIDNIKNDIDLFDKYIDYITIGEGEIPILKLIQMLEGKCNIEDVPSLIYKEFNIIKSNKLLQEKIKIAYNQDFDFTINKNYFLPEKVYPIHISKGCYWGKCKFCDFNLKYFSKPVDTVIKEIKFLHEKYDANYFYLTDSALSPKQAKEFAELLIKEKLNIRYTTFLRFEKVYDKKFLKLLYKSGLRCASWGLESGSQKVLNLMNKGTNINIIQRILNDTKKLGIANRLTIIYLFPGENYNDFCKTINFVKKNYNNIFFLSFHRYVLKKYSYVYNNKEEFNIKITSNETKFEYDRSEIGIPFNQEEYDKKLQEITSLKGGIYITPDEALLYISNIEKTHNNCLSVIKKFLKGKLI